MSDDFLHGGALDIMRATFPTAPTPWLDLSTGINPWPYPASGISAAALHHLPTQAANRACREAMARAMGAPAESLILAAGSELLIRLLPTILSPQRVAVLSPTYGDHLRVWKRAGCELIVTPEPLDLADKVDMIVVCNPNNPDGRLFDPEALERARRTLAARGGWLVLDEAYADLDPERSLAPHGGASGLIILRSLGKFYGLAGLRLGGMIAPPDICAQMSERLGVWNISGPALDIGTRAYLDGAWQQNTRETLQQARHRLDGILRITGTETITGTDLFRYIRHRQAAELWQHLARRAIYVRRFKDRPDYLRIGIPGDPPSEVRLQDAMTDFSLSSR